MITLTIEGKERQYPKGTTYEEIVKEYQPAYDNQIAVVAVNGKIRELFKRAVRSGKLEFFTWKDAVGNKTYVRTATMLLLKAIFDTVGAEYAQGCKFEFTVGNGYYISTGALHVTEELVDRLKKRMQELCEAKMPMIKKSYTLDDAMDLFREKGMTDKEKVFKYRRSSTVNVYEMEGYFDYYYGYMMPHAGYVKY